MTWRGVTWERPVGPCGMWREGRMYVYIYVCFCDWTDDRCWIGSDSQHYIVFNSMTIVILVTLTSRWSQTMIRRGKGGERRSGNKRSTKKAIKIGRQKNNIFKKYWQPKQNIDNNNIFSIFSKKQKLNIGTQFFDIFSDIVKKKNDCSTAVRLKTVNITW